MDAPGRVHGTVRVDHPGTPGGSNLLHRQLRLEFPGVGLDDEGVMGNIVAGAGPADTTTPTTADRQESRGLGEHADREDLGRRGLRLLPQRTTWPRGRRGLGRARRKCEETHGDHELCSASRPLSYHVRLLHQLALWPVAII